MCLSLEIGLCYVKTAYALHGKSLSTLSTRFSALSFILKLSPCLVFPFLFSYLSLSVYMSFCLCSLSRSISGSSFLSSLSLFTLLLCKTSDVLPHVSPLKELQHEKLFSEISQWQWKCIHSVCVCMCVCMWVRESGVSSTYALNPARTL